MVVVDAVVDHPAVPAALDEPKVPESSQMLRRRRFGDAHDVREVADAELLLKERVDYLDSARVSQSPKALGDVGVRVVGQAQGPGLHDSLRVDLPDLTDFVR